MNPDLHIAGELKNTGKGNLFVVFGERTSTFWRKRTGKSASR
jgi:adenine-specific DNA-methyltransferase